MTDEGCVECVVLISAETEWRAVRDLFPAETPHASPFGEWFTTTVGAAGAAERVVFFHGGWGKIAAAASTQYAIDRWAPRLLVNLGTCGGFAGDVARGETILVERTLVYDVVERMGDPAAAIAAYTTEIDLSWLREPLPRPVRRGLLLSADADLDPAAIAGLRAAYGAVAGDWESGAIAYVAARNGVRCLILRGVSDLVGAAGGEAYDGTLAHFTAAAPAIMGDLVRHLPAWLACRAG